MKKIDEIRLFFDSFDFKNRELVLDKCTKIVDLKKFTETHLQVLKSNSGNNSYKPYFDRLLKVYNILI